MDPQNQQETGQFGDTTEALTDSDAGQPVDNTDDGTTEGNSDDGAGNGDVEVKTEVNVDDNASEAASVETLNTKQTLSTSSDAGNSATNEASGLRGGAGPVPPGRPTQTEVNKAADDAQRAARDNS